MLTCEKSLVWHTRGIVHLTSRDWAKPRIERDHIQHGLFTRRITSTDTSIWKIGNHQMHTFPHEPKHANKLWTPHRLIAWSHEDRWLTAIASSRKRSRRWKGNTMKDEPAGKGGIVISWSPKNSKPGNRMSCCTLWNSGIRTNLQTYLLGPVSPNFLTTV